MFFYKENQTLYLEGWRWNMCRIMHEVGQQLKTLGAIITDSNRKGIIENRNTGRRLNVDRCSYIGFTYCGNSYYLQFDDNPFFEFYYCKHPIGTDKREYYLEEFPKHWLYDDCFSDTLTDTKVVEYAAFIVQTIISIETSGEVEK